MQAESLLRQKKYSLVLVNRIFDGDGSSGVDFIADLKKQADSPPVMLISDYTDAQQAAIGNGAAPGFGKSSLGSAETIDRLKQAIAASQPKSAGDAMGRTTTRNPQ